MSLIKALFHSKHRGSVKTLGLNTGNYQLIRGIKLSKMVHVI
jgi:hypothetical protein